MCTREYLLEMLYDQGNLYLNDLPAEYLKDGLALLHQMAVDELIYPSASTSGPYVLTKKGRAAYLSSTTANQDNYDCDINSKQNASEVTYKKGFGKFIENFKVSAEFIAALLTLCGAVIAFVRLFVS